MGAKSSRRYPEELKQRAVQMVVDLRSESVSEWEAMGRVADLLGIGSAETVRKWVRQAQIDAGARAGQTSEDSEVLCKLRRENAELKRLKTTLTAHFPCLTTITVSRAFFRDASRAFRGHFS